VAGGSVIDLWVKGRMLGVLVAETEGSGASRDNAMTVLMSTVMD
jgi:hypothetical protein